MVAGVTGNNRLLLAFSVKHAKTEAIALCEETLKRNDELGRTLALSPAALAQKAAGNLPAFLKYCGIHTMKTETFVPDPRLMDWPLWDSIPWDLQPFFVYDDLFGKPTVITEGRNEYERAMIRKAVRWNNAQFMKAFRQLDEGKGG